jgi:A/G-specific adenine glycosylase
LKFAFPASKTPPFVEGFLFAPPFKIIYTFTMKVSQKKKEEFVEEVFSFYKKNKRDLPWRPKRGRLITPHQILVSEFMLQQTSVPRVIQKYYEFLEKFPRLEDLAKAKNSDVLSVWVGLGYNRRALHLKKTAEILVSSYGGVIPKNREELKALPGVGDYMSGSLCAFVHNMRVSLIETNVRTVYMYHFFQGKEGVHDKEIFSLLEETMPLKDSREWYYALMDYGTYLKKEKKIKNSQSIHYVKQSTFAGSRRFVRGGIVKHLTQKPLSVNDITLLFPKYEKEVLVSVCEDLKREGIIKEKNKTIFLA